MQKIQSVPKKWIFVTQKMCCSKNVPGKFYAGNRLRAFSKHEKNYLDPDPGDGVGVLTRNRKNFGTLLPGETQSIGFQKLVLF
jgi:hypothetical protein